LVRGVLLERHRFPAAQVRVSAGEPRVLIVIVTLTTTALPFGRHTGAGRSSVRGPRRGPLICGTASAPLLAGTVVGERQLTGFNRSNDGLPAPRLIAWSTSLDPKAT
jgi:hypothetical protein